LLINPIFNRKQQYGELSKLVIPALPMPLGFLGGYLVDKGVKVKLIDEQMHILSPARLKEIIEDFSANIVGISCVSPVMSRAYELASMVKEISPDIKVILGGVHPSVLPEESLKNKDIDLVIRLEGEITLWECVQALSEGKELNSILGISYRKNGEIIHNPDRPFVKDLDYFPRFPYDLFMAEDNRYYPNIIITSRGCPWRCFFCSARKVTGNIYRWHSPERVMEEIETIYTKYHVDRINIADDNFCVNKERVFKICDLIKERGYHKKITWHCETRPNLITEPLLEKMVEAGCYQISFGIETASQRLLDLANKKITIESIIRGVKMAKKMGLKVRGSFILGLPTETRKESLATINFAKKLDLDEAKFSLATPFPGTAFYDLAIKEGFPVSENWERLSTVAGLGDNNPVYIPAGRTAAELKNLQRRAYLKFYLQPKQLWSLIKGKRLGFIGLVKIRSIKDLWRYSKIILPFLK
jgi:radical SAM superfamily enzyme YgiQ (UPF0313 family)